MHVYKKFTPLDIALLAMIELRKPKEFIGPRTTRRLGGRRKGGIRPRTICRVAPDGKIRAIGQHKQFKDDMAKLKILAAKYGLIVRLY